MWIDQYKPLGIILVGSYSNGYPGPQSDIDVHIVVEDQDWRERGNYYVKDFEIEYFINPLKQIYAYIETESNLHPHTAHMFNFGIILYEKDNIISQLKKTANEKLKDYPKLEGISKELYQYAVDDGLKDLYNRKDQPLSLAYQVTVYRMLEKLIEICCVYHQTFMEKTTKLMDQIKDLDSKFADLINNIMMAGYSYESMKQIVNYVENTYLDGKRPKNWTLKGPLRDVDN